MTKIEIIVDEEGLEILRRSVERNNGGKVADPNFTELVDYLKLNPPIEGSLDPKAKPLFSLKSRVC